MRDLVKFGFAPRSHCDSRWVRCGLDCPPNARYIPGRFADSAPEYVFWYRLQSRFQVFTVSHISLFLYSRDYVSEGFAGWDYLDLDCDAGRDRLQSVSGACVHTLGFRKKVQDCLPSEKYKNSWNDS